MTMKLNVLRPLSLALQLICILMMISSPNYFAPLCALIIATFLELFGALKGLSGKVSGPLLLAITAVLAAGIIGFGISLVV